MSKTLNSKNGQNHYPSNEDDLIINLKSRVETLLSENHETKWDFKWVSSDQYALVEIREIKGIISPEYQWWIDIRRPDLGQANVQKYGASKPIKSESEVMIEEIMKKNKEV